MLYTLSYYLYCSITSFFRYFNKEIVFFLLGIKKKKAGPQQLQGCRPAFILYFCNYSELHSKNRCFAASVLLMWLLQSLIIKFPHIPAICHRMHSHICHCWNKLLGKRMEQKWIEVQCSWTGESQDPCHRFQKHHGNIHRNESEHSVRSASPGRSRMHLSRIPPRLHHLTLHSIQYHLCRSWQI